MLLIESWEDPLGKEVFVDADLETFVQIAADEMDVDVASLYMFELGELVLRATFGLKPDSVGRVRMSITQGLTGSTFFTNRVVHVADARRHPRFLYFPATGEEAFRSFLGIPLSGRQGVLVFQTREKHAFSPSEIRAAALWADRMTAEWNRERAVA